MAWVKIKKKRNLFTHGALMSSQEFVQKCPYTPGSNWNLEMLACEERVNWSTRKKTNSQSRVENQQQTRPTYDAGSWNRTQDTMVGGKRSHHCAIPISVLEAFTCSWRVSNHD